MLSFVGKIDRMSERCGLFKPSVYVCVQTYSSRRRLTLSISRTAVAFWGHISQILSSLSPEWSRRRPPRHPRMIQIGVPSRTRQVCHGPLPMQLGAHDASYTVAKIEAA